jgi:hypothetical protein
MSTDLPLLSSNELSGKVDELKRTILKRGSMSIPLTIATTDSTGYENNAYTTVNLDDIYLASEAVGMPSAECWLYMAGGGITAMYKLPFTTHTTSNSINHNGWFYLSTYADPDGNHLDLNVHLRIAGATVDSVYTIYYKIYSERSYSADSWNYKSS